MRDRLLQIFCIIGAFVALWLVASPLMPIPGVGFGVDWAYFLSYLLVGDQWIRANGWLTPAYFTPAFCGGIPFLANPQSMQWSLPQLVFYLLGPQNVPLATLVLSAAAGGWGTWKLARSSFSVSAQFATFACVLFVLNGFLMFRMVAGHATYWVFCAVAWIAVLVLGAPSDSAHLLSRSSLNRMIGGGLLICMMVFAGALNFVVPVVLAVIVIVLMQQARTGLRMLPWWRLAGACLWSIPLSAIKLVPAFVLTLQYPREYLAKSLFTDPILLLDAFFSGFFWPQSLPPIIFVGSGQFSFFMHEFEFGVSIVPLIVLLMRGIEAIVDRRLPARPLPVVLLLVVLAIPIVASFGDQAWGAVLQHTPIINNNTLLVRWWSIYIIPMILFCSISLDRFFAPTTTRSWVMALATTFVILQFSLRDLDFYRHPRSPVLQPFDATSITLAHAALVSGGTLAPVAALGRWPAGSGGGSGLQAPESVVAGVSSLPCYEPLFGYLHEQFPATKLHAGPISATEDGFENLADPRCYLGGPDRSCQPGTRFVATDPAISRFVTYRTIPWVKPTWQVISDWTSSSCLLASLCYLIVTGAVTQWRKQFARSV